MRAWWSEYGKYVIAGVVIAVGLLFGYNQHQNNKIAGEMEASVLFETLAGHVSDGDLDNAVTIADELSSNYANTAYAAQAKLAMARLYMDKNRDQDAADALLAVVDGDSDAALKSVAKLRLARIYLYQDKPQAVVDLLSGKQNNAFSATYGEVLGDAYTALGRISEAQDAYQKVLMDPLSQSTVDQQLVQWKSLDLPDVAPASAAEPENAEPETAAVVELDEPVSEDDE